MIEDTKDQDQNSQKVQSDLQSIFFDNGKLGSFCNECVFISLI